MRAHSGPAAEPSGTTEVIEVIEVIEMIDVDFEAFGQPHPAPPRARSPRQPPRWQVIALVGTLLLVAVVVVLQPWRSPSAWRSYPVSLSPATLPHHQVLADPAAPLVSVLPGTDPTDEQLLAEGVGHVFAAEGATLPRGQWARFRVEELSAQFTGGLPSSADAAEVADQGSARQQLVWSPQPGQRWTVETHELTPAATRTFAAAVGVHGGQAALRSGYSLGSLRPVGGIASMVIAQRFLDGLTQGAASPAATVVRYRSVSTPASVATTRAPADAALAVRFLLGGADVLVRDEAAVVATTATLGTVVVWVEGGRMVVVTGPLPADAQLTVAAAVRAATADDPSQFDPSGETTVAVGSGATADGHVWDVSVEFGVATAVCVVVDDIDALRVCVTTLHASLAEMTYITTSLGIVVVALSNAPDAGLVQLTALDDRVTLLRMRPLIWNLSAAVFQPLPGQSYELLADETLTAVSSDGRLRPGPVAEPTTNASSTYVLDSPLVTAYSAGIPTPLDGRGQFHVWIDESGWLTAQSSPFAPLARELDAERRVVEGVELVSSLADPTSTSATVPLTDGWWLTVRGSGISDAELAAVTGEFRFVEQFLVRRPLATGPAAGPPDGAYTWGEEALFGKVHARSSYLTAEGEVVTLHVGVGPLSTQRRVFPVLVNDWSDDASPSPAGGLLLTGTIAASGEQLVTWAEGDLLVSLTGRVPLSTLLALTNSVRPAIGKEWRNQLDGLRPSYRLGQFATVASTDEWRAGLQLAQRQGRPQYLWWWSTPGNPSSTASIAVRDDPALATVFDSVVVPGATYVFVTVPDGDGAAVSTVLEARQGAVVVPLRLARPFPDLGFRIAVARFETPGAVSVWLAGEEIAP